MYDMLGQSLCIFLRNSRGVNVVVENIAGEQATQIYFYRCSKFTVSYRNPFLYILSGSVVINVLFVYSTHKTVTFSVSIDVQSERKEVKKEDDKPRVMTTTAQSGKTTKT